VNNREQATRLETNTIQPIPVDARHGTARDLFSVWFGSNLMLLTIVTGGLAVTGPIYYWLAGRTQTQRTATA
jgi:purine-cytosine permease-like protein